MSDLEPLLEQLREELKDIDVPTERLEIQVIHRGDEDCTCGVCGEAFQFKDTNIVDPDEFEYDDWDSEAVEEFHQPLEQQRLCQRCGAKFIQCGGEFPNEKQNWDTDE